MKSNDDGENEEHVNDDAENEQLTYIDTSDLGPRLQSYKIWGKICQEKGKLHFDAKNSYDGMSKSRVQMERERLNRVRRSLNITKKNTENVYMCVCV
jgi:hypothetical protein